MCDEAVQDKVISDNIMFWKYGGDDDFCQLYILFIDFFHSKKIK